MSVTLTNAERETHLNMAGDDHSQWELYTDDPYWIRRMEKVGIEPYRQNNAGGFFYIVPAGQVTVRRAKKPMTEEQRVKLSKQLKRARNAGNLQRETGKVGTYGD